MAKQSITIDTKIKQKLTRVKAYRQWKTSKKLTMEQYLEILADEELQRIEESRKKKEK